MPPRAGEQQVGRRLVRAGAVLPLREPRLQAGQRVRKGRRVQRQVEVPLLPLPLLLQAVARVVAQQQAIVRAAPQVMRCLHRRRRQLQLKRQPLPKEQAVDQSHRRTPRQGKVQCEGFQV